MIKVYIGYCASGVSFFVAADDLRCGLPVSVVPRLKDSIIEEKEEVVL